MNAPVVLLPEVAAAALASAWPGWVITPGPHCTWQAYKASSDGRSRRVIVERSPGELDKALRHAQSGPC
jgi:hypothetical protein